jgi:hypothetical protein
MEIVILTSVGFWEDSMKINSHKNFGWSLAYDNVYVNVSAGIIITHLALTLVWAICIFMSLQELSQDLASFPWNTGF